RRTLCRRRHRPHRRARTSPAPCRSPLMRSLLRRKRRDRRRCRSRAGLKTPGTSAVSDIAPSRAACYHRARRAGEDRMERLMAADNGAIRLLAGNSNRALSEAIAAYLAIPLAKAIVRRFADMEIFVELQENMRGADAYVLQSTSFPANDHLMELLIIIDAL